MNGGNMLTFEKYQQEVRTTAVYPNSGNNFVYPALGLCGESGEVAEKIKKVLRDKDGVMDEQSRAALKKELGDCCWYISSLCSELGFTLEEVAQENLDKLRGRRERGTLHGSGDNR
jgi:NTP pyrophosphatase (non-canonical NTP hydrolase)